MLARPAARTDVRRRLGVDSDLADSLELANLGAVEIDAHHLAVKSRDRVVPRTVQHLSWIECRIAFNVAIDIQPQRQNRAAALEGEQDPVIRLLAIQLAIAR